jgi:hypothetical protein
LAPGLLPPHKQTGQPPGEDDPLADRRREVDEKVLADLLRLNLSRTDA